MSPNSGGCQAHQAGLDELVMLAENGGHDGYGDNKESTVDILGFLPSPVRSTAELSGSPIISDITPKGKKFYQVVSVDQSKPGRFLTSYLVDNVEQVGDFLAITPEFKETIFGIREVEVLRDVRTQKSIVGQQVYDGVLYKGGLNQFEFLEYNPLDQYVEFSSEVKPFK